LFFFPNKLSNGRFLKKKKRNRTVLSTRQANRLFAFAKKIDDYDLCIEPFNLCIIFSGAKSIYIKFMRLLRSTSCGEQSCETNTSDSQAIKKIYDSIKFRINKALILVSKLVGLEMPGARVVEGSED